MQLCVTAVPRDLSCQNLPCGHVLAGVRFAPWLIHKKIKEGGWVVLPEEVEPGKELQTVKISKSPTLHQATLRCRGRANASGC